MAEKLVKQVTPPLQRIVVSGLLATVAAAALNAGWLWLTENKLHIALSIPKSMGSAVYVEAKQQQIVLATLMAGLLGTLSSLAAAKLVIAPRIWCLAVGFGTGLASLYGALTLPNQILSQHLSLAMFHAIATFSIVPALAWALEIRHHDLAQADIKYHQHVDAKSASEPEPVERSMIGAPENQSLNDTLIVDPSEHLPTKGDDTSS
jgi:hypothetical protein